MKLHLIPEIIPYIPYITPYIVPFYPMFLVPGYLDTSC